MLDRPRLASLDVDASLSDPAKKQSFVTPMFDIIAPRYDRFTRVFSLGMDAGWKRELLDAVASAAPRGATTALDLACGTGDLAFAVAERLDVRAIGIDASPEMIRQAQQRPRDPRVSFAVGDMMKLDARNASVDVITAGYAFRNVPDFRVALDECARVLRPGGLLATLDFYRPERAWWRTLFLGYLAAAGNLVGWAWHGEGVVYGYIAKSIEHFVTSTDFSNALRDAGFDQLHVSRKLLGGIAIHIARRH